MTCDIVSEVVTECTLSSCLAQEIVIVFVSTSERLAGIGITGVNCVVMYRRSKKNNGEKGKMEVTVKARQRLV